MTGRRTVPNVFVDAISIGGGDEMVQFQSSGQLKILLEEAGATSKVGITEDAIYFGPPPNGKYDCDLATDECITNIVNQYPLVLFSLSWCPECHRMFELLAMVGIPNPHVIDLDDYPGIKQDIRYQLWTRAKSKSVPSLFIKGEALGGFVNVNGLYQSGELVPILQKAGFSSIQEKS
jgi:glutaredoxin